MKKILLFLILISTIISCKLNKVDLEKGWWKYGSGFHFGDVIDFKRLDFKNDTIYINNIPKIVITNIEKGYFGDDDEIIIKDLKTNKTGVYHGK